MDPLLLAAMTLLTLAAGGVYSWLLDRALQRGPMKELSPRLEELSVQIHNLQHELKTAAASDQASRRGLEQGLLELHAAVSAQAGKPDQRALEAALKALLQAELGDLRRVALATQEALQALTKDQRGLAEAAEARGQSARSRWAALDSRLDGLEQHGAALGSRVHDLTEELFRRIEAIPEELALHGGLYRSGFPGPNLDAEGPLEQKQAVPSEATQSLPDQAHPENEAAGTPSDFPAQASVDAKRPAESGAEWAGLVEAETPLEDTAQSSETAQREHSHEDSDAVSESALSAPVAAAAGPAEGAEPAERELSASDFDAVRDAEDALAREVLETSSEALAESLRALELALSAAEEARAVARAENQALRVAGQAELERVGRHYARQIAAIGSELARLESALEGHLLTGEPSR